MSRSKRRCALMGALVVIALLAGGCSVRQGDFTVMTNRMVTLDRVDLDELPRAKRVEGEQTKLIQLLLIPFPLSAYPTIEGAVDDALDKGDGDLVTDSVITITNMHFILFATQKITVEGDVVRTRTGKGN